MSPIRVTVHQRGEVVGDDVRRDDSLTAHCGLCDSQKPIVASLGATTACPDCLRARLDAISVARYQLRDDGPGLPWGKISG